MNDNLHLHTLSPDDNKIVLQCECCDGTVTLSENAYENMQEYMKENNHDDVFCDNCAADGNTNAKLNRIH